MCKQSQNLEASPTLAPGINMENVYRAERQGQLIKRIKLLKEKKAQLDQIAANENFNFVSVWGSGGWHTADWGTIGISRKKYDRLVHTLLTEDLQTLIDQAVNEFNSL